MSKIVQVKGGAADCILIFKHAAITDPNGVTGGTYGYSSAITNDFLQSPFLGDGGGASLISTLGFAESTMTTYTTANARFMRNVTIAYSADAVAMTNNIANSNTWWWGVTASKTGDFKARGSDTNTVTVGSTSGTGPTTITLSGTPTIVSSAPQYVTFQSGALNGQTFAVSSVNTGAKTITTTLNTSTAGVGSTLFFYTLTHADSFQFIGNNTQAAIPPDNVYYQRYKNTRSDASFALQPLLGQTGAVAGSGNLSTVGTSFSTSTARTFVVGDFIHLTAGSQHYEYARVATVLSSPCVANLATPCGTLSRPFSADQTAISTWYQGKSSTNVAMLDVLIDAPGTGSPALELWQPQDGQSHWVIAQTTLAASSGNASIFDFRSAVPGFGLAAFGVYDSLWNGGTANTTTAASMIADLTPGFPTIGLTIDNNAFAWGSQGTNSASGVVTLDSNYKPTAGLSLAMRGVQKGTVADGTPFVPWDIYGTAISSGALVGAVAQ